MVPVNVPPASQLNTRASQIAVRLRDAMTSANRLHAWAARRGDAAGLVQAGWDPGDAADFMANVAALRQLAQIYNGQVSLPDPYDFGAALDDLSDQAGPG